MTKKIFGALRLGVFGRTVVEELSKFEQEVIALDKHESLVQDVAGMVTKVAVGDVTEIESLEVIGIAQCSVIVITAGSTLESSVLTIMHCKKLGVKTILTKAKNATYEEVLYGVGATKVITPEHGSGRRVASNMLRHHIESIIRIEDNIAMIEFSIPDSWVGKSLVQPGLQHKYDLNLIGIREKSTSSLDIHINPNRALEANTEVAAIANNNTFKKFDCLDYLK